MNYYAIGDTKIVISHHGVMGMHWGIRRYQSYGQGGYNRKGGETGKVVGDAKKQQKQLYKTVKTDVKIGFGGRATGHQPKLSTNERVVKMYESLSASHKKYEEAAKPFKDFNSLPDKKKFEYADKAADRDWNRKYKNRPENMHDPEEVHELLRMEYRGESPIYAFREYCHSKGLDSEKVFNSANDAYLKYSEERDRVAVDALGKYGDRSVNSYKYKNSVDKRYSTGYQTAKDVLLMTLNDMSLRDLDAGGYFLEEMPKDQRYYKK